MKKQITRQELNRLENLKGKVTALQNTIDCFVIEAEKITGEGLENDEILGSYTFDYILNDSYTIEELLEKLKIEIK